MQGVIQSRDRYFRLPNKRGGGGLIYFDTFFQAPGAYFADKSIQAYKFTSHKFYIVEYLIGENFVGGQVTKLLTDET